MILRTVFNISVIQRPAFRVVQNSREPGSNSGVKQWEKKFQWRNQLLIAHHNRPERWGPESDSWFGWTKKKMSSHCCWCRRHMYIVGKERNKPVIKYWLVGCFNFFLLVSPPSPWFYRKPKILVLYSSINSRTFFKYLLCVRHSAVLQVQK